MLIRKIAKIIAVVVSPICLYVLLKAGAMIWYSQTVDTDLHGTLLANAGKEFNDPNLLTIKNRSPELNYSDEVYWSNSFIRLIRTENATIDSTGGKMIGSDTIVFQKKIGDNWELFMEPKCFSFYAYVLSEKLLHLCDKIEIINQKGEIEGNLLSGIKIRSIEQLIQIDRKIYIIQNDYRLKWTTPRSLISGERPGPNLITAIEIDLDILKYKEHIIGYDQYWASSSYKKDVLK